MDKFIETVTAKIKADIEVDCKKHLEQRFSEEFCVYVNDAVKRVQDSYNNPDEEKWVDICDKVEYPHGMGGGLSYRTGASGVFIVRFLNSYSNDNSYAIDNYGNSYNYSRTSLKQLDFEKLQMENPDNYVYPLPKWCLDLVSTFNTLYDGLDATKLTKYLKDIAREVFEEAIYYNNLYSENYALKTELQELKSKLELTAPTDDLLGLDD